jgi:hypothetical protein
MRRLFHGNGPSDSKDLLIPLSRRIPGKLPHFGFGVGHGIGKQILRIAKGQDFAMSPGTLKKVLFILDMISGLAQ